MIGFARDHVRRGRAGAVLVVLGVAAVSSALAVEDTTPGAAPPASLEAIEVTSQKLSVETLIDRKIYRVSSDVQSTFGALSDILSVIPSVDVDPDGIVSLRGDTHVLILIDGKPSTQFAGASAGDNLQSIPASNIDRIEVLTTPPAQFKADGAAGVINIITRKKQTNGMSGSIQGSLGSGGRSVLGTDMGYRSGPLTAALTAGYRHDIRERLIQSDIVAPDATPGQLVDSSSVTNERIRRAVPTLALSADYALNDRQSLSGAFSWADRGGLRTYTQRNEGVLSSGVLNSASQRLSYGHDPETDYDQKFSFAQRLRQPDETLTVSAHQSTSNQVEHYDYIDDTFVPPSATFYDNLTFHEVNGITELDADYVLPLSKTCSLKLGYAYEQDDYRYGNVGNTVVAATGVQIVNPALADDFKFRQRIDAAYASYETGSGAWSWLGGLRAERTHTDALQITEAVATSGSYSRLYPSLHVNHTLSEDSSLSFGASRRVVRPDPDLLNPYIDHEYTPNLRAGNPDLKPQYTQSYEIGYGLEGKGRTNGVTGYYRRNRDGVTDVTSYLGNGISLTTKANLSRSDSAGFEFTSTGHIVPQLSYSVSGNLFYSQIDATALGITGLQSTRGLNAKVKLDYRPTGTDSAQVTVTRTDKKLTPQGYVSAINLVNLGYKHQIKSTLTAIATVTDLFDGQRQRRMAATPTFTEDYRRTTRGRVVYFGLVYAFGSRKDKQAGFEYDQSN